jgi:hypothetical protein
VSGEVTLFDDDVIVSVITIESQFKMSAIVCSSLCSAYSIIVSTKVVLMVVVACVWGRAIFSAKASSNAAPQRPTPFPITYSEGDQESFQ